MTDTSVATRVVGTDPPLSRPIQLAVAACLMAGSLLSAGPQYVEHLLAGDLDRKEEIA